MPLAPISASAALSVSSLPPCSSRMPLPWQPASGLRIAWGERAANVARIHLDGWMDAWMNGWTDGWMDGRMDG
eukprot:352699-Chlamydomonas_euryale.AAC.2